jgi:uncharacterized protein YciI
MFLILLHYLRPLPEVDRWVPEHRSFLERHYASGKFLLSGRKEPRDGGVILCRARSLDELRAVVAQDPFHREGLARYELVEFMPTMSSPELASLLSG